MTIDSAAPVEGNKVAVMASLTNRGDGSVDELPVTFSVDGTEITSTNIESIEPDAEFPLEFSWKAVKGDHKLEVSVNDQNFSKTLTVAKKTTPVPVGPDMTLLIAIAVVAVIAAVAVVAVVGTRKQRAQVQPPDDEGYQDQRVEESPFQPPEDEAPPVPAPEASAVSEEAKAKDAIDNTEKILADAENVGLDTTKARQSFKVARNFYEMGKYGKAMQYCRNAEESIG
jgi:hypothetical protein